MSKGKLLSLRRASRQSLANPSSPRTHQKLTFIATVTVSERHHYTTQANQTLALGLRSGFSPGFFFTFSVVHVNSLYTNRDNLLIGLSI